MKRIVALVVFVIVGAFLFAGPAHAQVCSNASLKGTYGFTEIGAPWNVIGLMKFDGKGNLTYDWTVVYSDGGIPSGTEYHTYTVNENCTFTFTGGINYVGVIVLDGKELRWVGGGQGLVTKGEAHKLRTQ